MTLEQHKQWYLIQFGGTCWRPLKEGEYHCVACSGSGFIDAGNSESGDVGYGWQCHHCGGSGRVTKKWDGALLIG
jgi:DnaJ-class molecular chaperone